MGDAAEGPRPLPPAGAVSAGNAAEQESAVGRLAALPLVSSGRAAVAAACACARDRHPRVGAAAATATKALSALTAVAATGTRPVLAALQPQIASANALACKGLEKLEEKLPVLRQRPEQVLAGSRELAASAAGRARGGVRRTRAALGRALPAGLDALLQRAEELLERGTSREPAPSAEGSEPAPRRPRSPGRLGALAASLRHRALQRALAGLRGARRALATLPNLHRLAEQLKRGIEGTLRGACQHLGLPWGPTEAAAPGTAGAAPGGTGAASRLAELPGEPPGPERRRTSRARSLHELPALVLAQGRERAQLTVDELLDYVAQHAPLPWLVGPFAPALVEYPEGSPVDMGKWDGCLAVGGGHHAPGSARLCSNF